MNNKGQEKGKLITTKTSIPSKSIKNSMGLIQNSSKYTQLLEKNPPLAHNPPVSK
jgi:hypothetical protein